MIKFVHPRFQGMVVAFGVAIAAVCLAVVFVAQNVFFARSREALVREGLPPDHAVFYFLDQQRVLLNAAFLLSIAVGVLFALILGWVLSDRVATPLKQMQDHFNRVADGAVPTKFHFRKTDFFQEVIDAYNRQLEKLGLLPRTRDNAKEIKIK